MHEPVEDGVGEGVVRGAEHGDENLSLAHFACRAIDNADRLACIADRIDGLMSARR